MSLLKDCVLQFKLLSSAAHWHITGFRRLSDAAPMRYLLALLSQRERWGDHKLDKAREIIQENESVISQRDRSIIEENIIQRDR